MSTECQDISIVDWGRTGYTQALDKQMELLGERRENRIPDTLVFTEHTPVYTIGKRSGADRHLTASEDFLRKNTIDVVRTNRGGDITYHGPGQIVGYLFVDLSRKRDLHRLLREVENLLLATLQTFGIEAGRRSEKTGVWIAERKIAAIGMAARHWISFHGFALNVNTNLSHYGGIVPCGIVDGTVTSMARELGKAVSVEDVKNVLAREFPGHIRHAV